jgi:hypothetical protein
MIQQDGATRLYSVANRQQMCSILDTHIQGWGVDRYPQLLKALIAPPITNTLVHPSYTNTKQGNACGK